jgi:hypothetical protein
MKLIGKYLFNILLSLDQFLNVLLLGDVDETISGRTGRAMASGHPKWFVPPFAKALDWVFFKWFKDDNHSYESIEFEENFRREIWSWIKRS